MNFSKRSAFDPTPNELSLALEHRRARGERVFDLTESNPTRAGIAYDDRAILGALSAPGAMRYEPAPFGIPSARDAVAKAMSADPSRVVLTASTSEAYAFLFALFCDAGDEVLAPAPSYPLFSQLAALSDVRLVPYRLRYDGAWHVDLASLRAARSPRTRAVLVVSPNNPTGSCLTRDELSAMEELGLPIVCDEVFAEYMFLGGRGRVACAARDASRSLVFSLGGLSKLAALPQMKLAWTIAGGPEELVAPALERLAFIADAYLSVATPVQHALPALLAAGEVSRRAIAERTRANLAALDRAVAGTAATRLDLEGGWYATLRAPRVRSEMETCLRALDRGAYVHPGSFFGFEDEAYVVVSLLTREQDFAAGTAALLDAIR
jgi:alanine-synthesizing transaminase